MQEASCIISFFFTRYWYWWGFWFVFSSSDILADYMDWEFETILSLKYAYEKHRTVWNIKSGITHNHARHMNVQTHAHREFCVSLADSSLADKQEIWLPRICSILATINCLWLTRRNTFINTRFREIIKWKLKLKPCVWRVTVKNDSYYRNIS